LKVNVSVMKEAVLSQFWLLTVLDCDYQEVITSRW